MAKDEIKILPVLPIDGMLYREICDHHVQFCAASSQVISRSEYLRVVMRTAFAHPEFMREVLKEATRWKNLRAMNEELSQHNKLAIRLKKLRRLANLPEPKNTVVK